VYNPTATEDLKVKDIFESKVKLLQSITEWSIKHGVSFTPVKTNKSCHTIICAFIREGDNVCRDMCLWKLHAFISKSVGGYFKTRSYIKEHTCSQPSLRSNYCKVTYFVCNVILPMVRKKLDMTLSYIIEYIEVKYHINITYNKVWNARTKAGTKIFGDWESSYEILLQYLNATKISNSGIVTAHYFEPYAYGMVQFLRICWAFGPSIKFFQY